MRDGRGRGRARRARGTAPPEEAAERPRADAFEVAVRVLAQRTHFRAEVAAKLARRGFSAEEVEAALTRLAELRYLDDAAAARQLVAERRERRGWGRARLAAELQRRGAAGEDAEAALGGLDEAGERELAARELARLRRRLPEAEPAALARRLSRKGFAARVIFDLLRQGGAELDEPS